MGHFGFSWVGLIFLLLITIPNLVWTRHKPHGYDPSVENRILLIFERVGQVLVTCAALCFSDYNFLIRLAWAMWMVAACALILIYKAWWIRYFLGPRRIADFYSSILDIPVAGATLPVLSFMFLGIYGKVIWLILGTIILGIGHIGIHLQHRARLKGREETVNCG